MILFPAIDLKDGQAVRLKQGDYAQATFYEPNPRRLAERWAQEGAKWIHLVDLDAARSGIPAHFEIIAQIAAELPLKVQVGGGIRNLDTARLYLEAGVSRLVVGTRAIQDPSFLAELTRSFPQKIALGLDARAGKIAVQGWSETTALDVAEYLQSAPLDQAACLIFTDISRDGMLTGPNLDALKSVLAASRLPVIASGGIASLADIRALAELEDCRLLGVIVGKALYENKFSLREALRAARF